MKRLLFALVVAFAFAPLCLAGTRDLKQSTPVTIVVGPFVDSAGASTSPTVTGIDVTGYKNDGTIDSSISPTASSGNNDMVATDDGYYSLELTSSNTDTAGYYRLTFQISGALIFHEDFNILPANIYDSRYDGGTTLQKVDVTKVDTAALDTHDAGEFPADVRFLLGTAWLPPATAGTPDVNVKLAGGTAWNSGAIGAATLAADTIGSSELALAAAEEIASRSCIAAGTVSGGSGTAWSVNGNADWSGFGIGTDLVGCIIVFQDSDDLGTTTARVITAMEENAITLSSAMGTFINAGDKFRVYASSSQIPTILDHTGTSGVVVASGSKSGYALSGTQTFNNTGTWTGNLSGSVGSIGTDGITNLSFGAGAIDGAAIAANAIGASEVADGAIDAGALASGTITSAKFDGSTAFPLTSVDTGTTRIARMGADSDTLETLSDQVDAVKAKTDNLPTSPAAVGSEMGLANDAITASKIGTGAIDADSLAADAGTELATANWASTTRTLSAATNITSSGGTITTSGGAVTVGTNNDKSGYALSTSGIAGIWNALTSGMSTTGSIGKRIVDNLNAEIGDLPPQSYFEALFDGAPTFADAMDDHGYTTPRAEKIDKLAPSLLVSTTISGTPSSQTSFVLAAGPGNDDALNGALVIVTDSVDDTQKAVGLVKVYDESTKTVTLVADPGVFTFAAGDTVDVIAGGAAIPLWLSGP